MKKTLFVLLLLLSQIFTSVAFAQCTLNTKQWLYIGNNGNNQLYIDAPNVEVNGSNVEAGLAIYFPTGCGMKHPGSKGEHYHYSLYCINYNVFSFAMKTVVFEDMAGNDLRDGIFLDDEELIYKPIPRGTTFGKWCETALQIAGKL